MANKFRQNSHSNITQFNLTIIQILLIGKISKKIDKKDRYNQAELKMFLLLEVDLQH